MQKDTQLPKLGGIPGYISVSVLYVSVLYVSVLYVSVLYISVLYVSVLYVYYISYLSLPPYVRANDHLCHLVRSAVQIWQIRGGLW